MQVAFRADASPAMGSGHLIRCLVLADALKLRGAQCSFITRAEKTVWAHLIEDKGHRAHFLTPLEQAAEDSKQTLPEYAETSRPDLLVVDHYGLDSVWEREMRKNVGSILAIDDIGRAHDCDWLLDVNVLTKNEDAYRQQVPPDCRRLLGPRYALLAPIYSEQRSLVRARRAPGRRVCISFGGSDPENETLKAARATVLALPADTEIVIIVGPQYRSKREELDRLAANNANLRVIGPVPTLAPYYVHADLGLGAAGGSSWERCCLGLPAIATATAENQLKLGTELQQQGAIDFLGSSPSVSCADWQASIAAHIDSDWLESASVKALGLVDGEGANRVADQLLS